MRILYHEHARERMAARGITEAMVEETLTAYDTTMPANKDRTKYIKHFDKGGSVTVVAAVRKVSDTHFVVYTVFQREASS